MILSRCHLSSLRPIPVWKHDHDYTNASARGFVFSLIMIIQIPLVEGLYMTLQFSRTQYLYTTSTSLSNSRSTLRRLSLTSLIKVQLLGKYCVAFYGDLRQRRTVLGFSGWEREEAGTKFTSFTRVLVQKYKYWRLREEAAVFMLRERARDRE